MVSTRRKARVVTGYPIPPWLRAVVAATDGEGTSTIAMRAYGFDGKVTGANRWSLRKPPNGPGGSSRFVYGAIEKIVWPDRITLAA